MTDCRARLALALLALAVAIGALSARPAVARDADLIISQKADVETFDPSQSNNTTTHNVTINVFDTLIRLSDDGKDWSASWPSRGKWWIRRRGSSSSAAASSSTMARS